MEPAPFVIPSTRPAKARTPPPAKAIPKKQPSPATPPPEAMDVDAGEEEDPLLSSLLDTRPASSSSSTPTLLPTTPQPPLPPQQHQQHEHKSKKSKKKSKKEGEGKRSTTRKRLLVPGAGHDDSFLYTLRAAGVAGHDEYDEYVLMDTLEAVVTEEVRHGRRVVVKTSLSLCYPASWPLLPPLIPTGTPPNDRTPWPSRRTASSTPWRCSSARSWSTTRCVG